MGGERPSMPLGRWCLAEAQLGPRLHLQENLQHAKRRLLGLLVRRETKIMNTTLTLRLVCLLRVATECGDITTIPTYLM